jgi:hypothetical protein
VSSDRHIRDVPQAETPPAEPGAPDAPHAAPGGTPDEAVEGSGGPNPPAPSGPRSSSPHGTTFRAASGCGCLPCRVAWQRALPAYEARIAQLMERRLREEQRPSAQIIEFRPRGSR